MLGLGTGTCAMPQRAVGLCGGLIRARQAAQSGQQETAESKCRHGRLRNDAMTWAAVSLICSPSFARARPGQAFVLWSPVHHGGLVHLGLAA